MESYKDLQDNLQDIVRYAGVAFIDNMDDYAQVVKSAKDITKNDRLYKSAVMAAAIDDVCQYINPAHQSDGMDEANTMPPVGNREVDAVAYQLILMATLQHKDPVMFDDYVQTIHKTANYVHKRDPDHGMLMDDYLNYSKNSVFKKKLAKKLTL